MILLFLVTLPLSILLWLWYANRNNLLVHTHAKRTFGVL